MEYLDYTKITRAYIGDHGAYIIDDKLTLVLAQQAYIDGGFDTEPYYTALAHNLLDEDDEYKIEWTILDGYDSELRNDESDACDWDNPSYILRY